MFKPCGTGRHWPARAPRRLGITTAGHQRTHGVTDGQPGRGQVLRRATGHRAGHSSPGRSDTPGGMGYSPLRCSTSGRFTPEACTAISNSPGWGLGHGPFARLQHLGPTRGRDLDGPHVASRRRLDMPRFTRAAWAWCPQALPVRLPPAPRHPGAAVATRTVVTVAGRGAGGPRGHGAAGGRPGHHAVRNALPACLPDAPAAPSCSA
jgi:hypothetical protein